MSDDSVEKICAELRRLAVDGIAPSKERYDQQRDRRLPSSGRLPLITGMLWQELVEKAGLQLSPISAKRIAARVGVPARLEKELSELRAGDQALYEERFPGGLPVLESSWRVREFYVRQRDGSVRRVVQESVSLR